MTGYTCEMIVACRDGATGDPMFTTVTVHVTQDEYSTGMQYRYAEDLLRTQGGFRDPFVVYDEEDFKEALALLPADLREDEKGKNGLDSLSAQNF